MALVIAVLLIGSAALTILTWTNPQRNALTKATFSMLTIAPRVGSMTDRQWVLLNGVVLLFGGLFLLGWVLIPNLR